ncbi:unnamed protein product [Pieris macdunnoughi]|uniref:Uncharacterized protein n=1 Tax=Pieris macdunnoughi TaxID=345717 RepID=A0A821LTG7_9NEOP|nr:unnamed protein product [Pieris macdunnoughi]
MDKVKATWKIINEESGCEAWTLTVKEEQKLLVTKLKILRKILGQSRREDVSWIGCKNDEIKELEAQPNIIGQGVGQERAVKEAYLVVGDQVGLDTAGSTKWMRTCYRS